jgi:hypothetical protein
MGQFRTHTRDVAPPIVVKKTTPGELPDNRIGVFDHKGRRHAHVGYKASETTASRWVRDPKLGKKDGRPAWLGAKPARVTSNNKHTAQVRQARGSISENPSAPETIARPRKG